MNGERKVTWPNATDDPWVRRNHWTALLRGNTTDGPVCVGRQRRAVALTGIIRLSAAIGLFFSVFSNAAAWTEQDLIGEWDNGAGEEFRFGSNHQFEFQDRIHFRHAGGEFAKVDENIKLSGNGLARLFLVQTLTSSDLVLNVEGKTDPESFRRQDSAARHLEEEKSQ
jgi:hypothetical protein